MNQPDGTAERQPIILGVEIWPPPVIAKWIGGGTVATDALAAELRAWADYVDLGEMECKYVPSCGNPPIHGRQG